MPSSNEAQDAKMRGKFEIGAAVYAYQERKVRDRDLVG